MPVNRTPPRPVEIRNRSLSAGNRNKRKAEGSAEKERKSRSTTKKPNTSKDLSSQVNNSKSPATKTSSQVNKHKSPATKTSSQVKLFTKPSKPPSETHCGRCNKKFDDDNCVFCECCKYWFHAACVNLTVEEISAFTLLGPKAHWYCENCDAGAKELYMQHVEFKSRLDRFEESVNTVKAEQSAMCSDIEKLKVDTEKDRENIKSLDSTTKSLKVVTLSNADSIKSYNEALENLKKEVEDNKTQTATNSEKLNSLKTTILKEVNETLKLKVSECMKEINLDQQFPLLPTSTEKGDQNPPAVQERITQFRELVNDQCAEHEEIMKRKLQLMIFNLKEAANPEADKQQTYDLLNLLQIDEEIKIENLTRMGKSREGKHKPIRITLGNLSSKRKILAKASKLRDVPDGDRFARVYIKPNLTVRQWQESKNLMEDLRIRKLAEPNKMLKISKGKIVKVQNNQ